MHPAAEVLRFLLQNLDTGVSSDVQEAAAVVGAMDKQADPKALKVCIMTADFWGLKSAGGTATAYHLLAAVLAKSKALHVSVPSARPQDCQAVYC